MSLICQIYYRKLDKGIVVSTLGKMVYTWDKLLHTWDKFSKTCPKLKTSCPEDGTSCLWNICQNSGKVVPDFELVVLNLRLTN